jgi:hypothetical protein
MHWRVGSDMVDPDAARVLKLFRRLCLMGRRSKRSPRPRVHGPSVGTLHARTWTDHAYGVARTPVGYEVRNKESQVVMSRYRTRQAAVDAWRERWPGVAVQIWRRYSNGTEVLVVEGTWYQPRSSRVLYARRTLFG